MKLLIYLLLFMCVLNADLIPVVPTTPPLKYENIKVIGLSNNDVITTFESPSSNIPLVNKVYIQNINYYFTHYSFYIKRVVNNKEYIYTQTTYQQMEQPIQINNLITGKYILTVAGVNLSDDLKTVIALGNSLKIEFFVYNTGKQVYINQINEINKPKNFDWFNLNIDVLTSDNEVNVTELLVNIDTKDIIYQKVSNDKKYITITPYYNSVGSVTFSIIAIANGKVSSPMEFKLNVQEDISLQLKNGWNLVSIPYNTPVIDINNSSLKAFDIWSYDNGSWSKYQYGSTKNNLTSLIPTKGYWIKSNGDYDIYLPNGEEYNPFDTVVMQSGWNLLGSGIEIQFDDINKNLYQSIWVYRDNEWYSNVLEEKTIGKIKKGEGFWLKK
ncbi:MAG: hypothetical protein HXX81_05720 [Campylobacterales bacterium]|nr:hypothetical protein [Campylobacterales bacterium]